MHEHIQRIKKRLSEAGAPCDTQGAPPRAVTPLRPHNRPATTPTPRSRPSLSRQGTEASLSLCTPRSGRAAQESAQQLAPSGVPCSRTLRCYVRLQARLGMHQYSAIEMAVERTKQEGAASLACGAAAVCQPQRRIGDESLMIKMPTDLIPLEHGEDIA